MNNVLDVLKMISNPQQYVLNMVGQDNPILNNMIQLAQQGKNNEVEKIARNIFEGKGMNYDKEIAPILDKFNH